jgi:hypothetical protein
MSNAAGEKIKESLKELQTMITIANGLLIARPPPLESLKATIDMMTKLTKDIDTTVCTMSQRLKAADAKINFLTTPKVSILSNISNIAFSRLSRNALTMHV